MNKLWINFKQRLKSVLTLLFQLPLALASGQISGKHQAVAESKKYQSSIGFSRNCPAAKANGNSKKGSLAKALHFKASGH
ncbi:MAG: hypothetical protein WKF92_15855 [Pyrinomonadaceae bacterium]